MLPRRWRGNLFSKKTLPLGGKKRFSKLWSSRCCREADMRSKRLLLFSPYSAYLSHLTPLSAELLVLFLHWIILMAITVWRRFDWLVLFWQNNFRNWIRSQVFLNEFQWNHSRLRSTKGFTMHVRGLILYWNTSCSWGNIDNHSTTAMALGGMFSIGKFVIKLVKKVVRQLLWYIAWL